MKNRSGLSSLLLILLVCSSCATSPIAAPVRIGAQDNASQDSDGLLEDASKIRSFNIFPDSISTSIERIQKSSSAKKEAYREIQKLFCNGTQSKLKGEFRIKVMTPQKSPPGTAIDKITKAQSDFLYWARLYLKNRFFFTSGEKPVTRLQRLHQGSLVYEDRNFNPDFASYMLRDHKEFGENQREHYYTIPYLSSQNKAESFYSKLEYIPTFYEKRWIENPNNPSFQIDEFFFSIISPNRSALLVPKASAYLKVGYDENLHSFFGEDPIPQFGVGAIAELSDTLQALPTNSLETYYKHGQVMISESGWQIKEQDPIYPFQISYAGDLNFLIENYTFILNREIIEKEFHISDPSDQQNLGVDYNTGAFVASEAIDRKNWIWSQMLRRSTLLKEAPTSAGITEFIATFDTSSFCRFGSPVTDLQN